jgi:hypothetical protein
MTELEARRVGLLRAFEDPLTPPWTEADRLWAHDEARRQVGEQATPEAFVAARASVALQRLGQRDEGLRSRIEGILRIGHVPLWLAAVIVAAAFAAGLAVDTVGSQGRIHLLAPPLLALLAWNLAVYAGLLLGLLRRAGSRRAAAGRPGRSPPRTQAKPAEHPGSPGPGPLRSVWERSLAGLLGLTLRRPGAPAGHEALARATAGQWPLGGRLWSARCIALLHGAAAAIALGALASLYLRGIAFEFRAGWDSTFLSAQQALDLLGAVLGPASRLGGLALPDAAGFAALRFSTGPGENAARWIHLWAITLGGLVVLPRLALAGLSAWRARQRSRQIALPWTDPYLQRLAALRGGGALHLRVLPYAHQPGPQAHELLAASLRRTWGGRATLSLLGSVAEGDEEAVAERRGARESTAGSASGPTWTLPLMSLHATPERETHGRFLLAAAALRGPGQPALLLVNEAGFGARLSPTDADSRRRHRRATWRRLASDLDHAVVFLDLSPGSPALQPGPLRDETDDALAVALRSP